MIMDRKKYINELKLGLENAKKDEKYIDLCVNYANKLINNNLPVIFDIEHFALLIGINKNILNRVIYSENSFYKNVEIPKKNGDKRELSIPSLPLKYMQKWILDNILYNIPISKFATGFCRKKSIVTNARQYIGKQCIINIDIKDFFPSIKIKKIFNIFYYYGYTKEVSFLLSKLCCYKGKLPQGSPASPYLSNIASLKIDKRISKLAKKYNANYSRYADDITISGNYGIIKCKDIIKTILEEEGFNINDRKTRILYKHQRQEVTGIIVNSNKITVGRKYKRKLMQEIYFCLKFGFKNHLKKININRKFYKGYLYGKAYFVNMVEPKYAKNIFKLLDKIDWDY